MKFNVKGAPWWGGFKECLGALIERCLEKVVNNSRLLYTELLTTLFEVKDVLNDRMLFYSYDNQVTEVLTLNCLLYGRHLNSANGNVCESDAADVEKNICGKENVRLTKLLNVFGMCGIKNTLLVREDSGPIRLRLVQLR